MSCMSEVVSPSEIEARAQELALSQLAGLPSGHVHYVRTLRQLAAGEVVRIAIHERAAELLSELIAAAPGIWSGRKEGAGAAAAAVGAEGEQ